MDIRTLKTVFFSPTGTTRAVAQAIARGIDLPSGETINITEADTRKRFLQTSPDDLLIVAVPVYVGRVPEILLEWLNAIHARQTPAVCVVVYGNREFDDALLELKDILTDCGCQPIAAAAFVGEHSFSSKETPIAVARPDAGDLDKAVTFGRKIKAKLAAAPSADHMPALSVPGSYPYRKREATLSADFIAISDRCVQCGVCAAVCPVAAIDSEDSALRDEQKCILCCACIKGCPENARAMKAGNVKDVAVRLNEMCKPRKEPVYFL